MSTHGSHRMRRQQRDPPKKVRRAQVETVEVLTNKGTVIKMARRRAERYIKNGKIKKILG